MKSKLYNKKESIDFYEKRYIEGRLNNWPDEKRQRIVDLIQGLHIPQKGKVLDFGCGNGFLTDTIRQALPGWKIYGTDISKTAIQNAISLFPNCTFFHSDDPKFRDIKFDFIFTHHVFEHVYNLQETFDQMVNYLQPDSFMLHMLPCGNEGSFEHEVCLLRRNGINSDMEGRFFFEDEGHVRRLTTDQFRKLAGEKGFYLKQENYSNQYYGAINWITTSNPKLVLAFTNSRFAINKSARWKLSRLRCFLLPITLIRLPAQVIHKYLLKMNRGTKDHILFILAIPFYLFSLPAHTYWIKKTKEEWVKRKTERNGSEMALFFARNSRKS